MEPKCCFCEEAEEHIATNGPKKEQNCAVLCLSKICRYGSQRKISRTKKQEWLSSVFISQNKGKHQDGMCVSTSHMTSIL